MHIGILQCDQVRHEHQNKYPDYPQMFSELLLTEDPSLTFTTYPCMHGKFPENSAACDGWLITGSKYSCYNNLPWMLTLEDFIRGLYFDAIPCVGICFGHQIIAQALGGTVSKSNKGWGIGTALVTMHKETPWTQPFKASFSMLVSHQDQVVTLPQGIQVLAGNGFCPNFMLHYDKPLMSIQGHPEFSKDYTKALIETRIQCIGKECAQEAITSLSKPIDNTLFAKWILAFFYQNQ